MLDSNLVPPDVRSRFARVDHRGSYLQMHFALDGMPTFAAPYETLNDPPEMQSAIGLFSTPEELQRQWEDSRRGIVPPPDPAVAMQFPSVHDSGLAPPEGKHAMSAFSMWFPLDYEHASYGDLKGGDGSASHREDHPRRTRLRVQDHPPHHLHTTPHGGDHVRCTGWGDYCHGLIHPEQMGGPNRPGPRGFVDLPIPVEGGCTSQRRLPRRSRNHLHPPRIQRRRAGTRRRQLVVGGSRRSGATLVGPVRSVLGAWRGSLWTSLAASGPESESLVWGFCVHVPEIPASSGSETVSTASTT